MDKPARKRFWFAFAWLHGWSRPERGVMLALALLPLLTLALGGRDWGWLAGLLALVALGGLQIVIHCHGGWRLLGPHFYYDVVRLARRGRSTILRVLFITALFVGLWWVVQSEATRSTWRPNELARAAEHFAFTLFMIQNMAILFLAPAYLGSAIAEEKERHTLELLFTTQLSDLEIVLGKLFSRIIHLAGFVLAGFPILCLVQFWGGIDMLLIVGNVANTLLNILSLGSFCLLISVLARTVSAAVMASYVFLLPSGFCCVATLKGFPFVLQDFRSGGQGVNVQDIGLLCILHLTFSVFCIGLTVLSLRGPTMFDPVRMPPRRAADPALPSCGEGRPTTPIPATGIQSEPILTVTAAEPERPHLKPRHEPEPADMFAVPYVLPPVGEHALMWKERHVGGPPLFFSPIVLVPLLPFLVTGVLLMIFWFAVSFMESDGDHRNTREVWAVVLRFFYYVFLGCYVLGVAFRAAAAVARERQQQTLEPLLLLPIDRREILAAKWIGSLQRGWPWLALMIGNAALGLVLGAYHPFSAVLLCLAPWPLILFFASLGLLLSVMMRTVLRAYLVLVAVLVLLIVLSLAAIMPLGYIEAFVFHRWLPQDRFDFSPYAALVTMAVYLGLAAASWKMAVSLFENRAS